MMGQKGKLPGTEHDICVCQVQLMCADLSISTGLFCSLCHMTIERRKHVTLKF